MKTSLLATALAVLALAAGPVLAQTDNAALFAATRAAQPAVIETLKERVAIESGTMDKAGLARMTDMLEAQLKSLGATVERRQTTAGNSDVLIACFEGTGKRRLVMIVHMDTIHFPGALAGQPIKQEGNKLFGPGIADDNGGLAVVLHSLAVLQRAGWRNCARLTVVFNGDQESGSRSSGETIAEWGAEHDVVLSFEPTSSTTSPVGEGVLLAAAGTARAQRQVKGRASHAGAAPQLGCNALIETAHQMLQTQDVAKDVPGAQLNWMTLSTGTVSNQIPETATVGGDVWLTRADAAPKLLPALQARAAEGKRVPGTETTVSLQIGRPPYIGDEGTLALAKKARAIYAELDGCKLALHPITGGAIDARFAQRSGKPAVLERMGLPGAGYHARDQYIDLDAIVPRLYLNMRRLVKLGKE